MCLINYIKENKKYKHLNYAERTMIERWHNKDHKSNKDISLLLNKSERTIRREIKRGLTKNLTTEYEYIYVYSADIAQEKYMYNLEAKGPNLKIGNNNEIANIIKDKIKSEKKSPEVISYELKKEDKIKISNVTIRNYIKKGIILDLTEKDLTYDKTYNNKNKEKRIAKHMKL